MQPWLIDTDLIRLPAWVPLVACAAVVVIAAMRHHARRVGLSNREAVDSGWIVFPAALVGARLGDVALGNPALLRYPTALLDPLGGYSLYGAAIGGLIGALVYARQRRLDTRALVDAWALGALLAFPLARMACLAVGCCYGRAVDGVIGVTIRAGGHPMQGVSVHPVVLYEAITTLLLFVLLARTPREAKPGRIAVGAALGYSVCRILLDPLRDDGARGVLFGPVSASQLAAGLTILAALTAWRAHIR